MLSLVLRQFKSKFQRCTDNTKGRHFPFPTCCKDLSAYKANDSKYIIKGQPLEPIVGQTIPEYVFANIAKFEDRSAFTCGLSKRSYTYKQIYAMSYSFAAALIQNGLKKGDVVGVMLLNLPEFSIVILGTWLAGGVISPISSSFTTDEVAHQCKIASTKILVTMPFFLEMIQSVKSMLPDIQSVINIGEPMNNAHSFSEMVKVNSKGIEFAKGSNIDTKNELAMLACSSGTTGPPKAVQLTHCNFCSNAEQYLQPGVNNVKGDERYIGLLPFYHVFGCSSLMLIPIRIGGHVCTLPKFNPMTFIDTVRSHKPTTLHVATPLIQFMAMSPEFTKAEFESVHTIISGAASVGKKLIQTLLDKAGKYIFFQEGYGMTECVTVSHISRAKYKNGKIGSIGEIFPGTECKVVDEDTGESLPQNKSGELWLRGPHIMKGYYKNETATKESLTPDGWLRTGDVVTYDEDKCFYVVGRIKELIKVKGLQVSPSELEDLLRTNHEILDVAVVGVKHEKLGEAPRAFIVRQSEKLTAARVHDFLERKIAPHKKLAGGIEFIESIPRAQSGKILKRLLVANDLTGNNRKG